MESERIFFGLGEKKEDELRDKEEGKTLWKGGM